MSSRIEPEGGERASAILAARGCDFNFDRALHTAPDAYEGIETPDRLLACAIVTLAAHGVAEETYELDEGARTVARVGRWHVRTDLRGSHTLYRA